MTPTLQEDTALMPGHAKFHVFNFLPRFVDETSEYES